MRRNNMSESETIKICNTIGFAISFSNPQVISLNTTKEELTESMRLAVQALEKQISKKPTYEGDGYADEHLVYDTWICPCCEKRYEVDYDNYDYCPNCGQKLDWEGDDE
jgi:transcription initiation factor IIE alpha subunit